MSDEHNRPPDEMDTPQRASDAPPTPPADQPTLTVSLLDLIAPSEAEIPPPPIMTTGASLSVAVPPDDDDEITILPPLMAADPGRREPPTPTTPPTGDTTAPAPRFTPLPRPPEQDDGATTVNPALAFGAAQSQPAKPQSAEEVRRARQQQRERQQQQRVETAPSALPPANPQRGVSRAGLEGTAATPRAPQPAAERPAAARPLPAQENRPVGRPAASRPAQTPRVVVPPTPAAPPRRERSGAGCVGRALLIGFFLLFFGAVLSVIGLTLGYILIARDLPSVTNLRPSEFQTARIYDRSGELLYSLADPNIGNRTYVPLSRIDPDLINATIATEDARFYTNPGFDPIAIARAVYQAVVQRDFTAGGGASTITQQVVRNLLLSEDERGERTARRKVREIILAAELGRTVPKDTILELYLNEIYYGNRAYGIEAAAETYFNKTASNLTLSEASLLAGLPQAPAWWDPITAPELALGRQKQVLELMVAQEMVGYDEAQQALNQSAEIVYNLKPPTAVIRYPHFTLSVLAELENRYGNALYRGGFEVYTTIDPAVQKLAEDVLAQQRGNINRWGANNAALVALDPRSGQILAMVGSLDFRDEAISGQVNMVRAPRQPGSSIKPFVYLAAMEQGFTPATLFWDVPSAFPDGVNPDYTPKNFDDQFHGTVLLREALGNSYNIPAVKALEYVGVCNFVQWTQSLGLGLQDPGCAEQGRPRNYGLALALGGGEISPLQMASAYALLANQGRFVQPYAITRIEKQNGQTEFQYTPPSQNETTPPVSAEHAFLLSDILSDNNARLVEFGANNLLTIPGHRVAAKTGTSGTSRFDARDGWTIGYTPEIVTAVWIGNTDNQPLAEGGSGYRAAAPIWNQFMTAYLSGRPATPFVRPDAVREVEICADSGTLTTPACDKRRMEWFAASQPPLPAESHFLRRTRIDLWTLRVANEFCNDEAQFETGSFNLLITARPDVAPRYQREVEAWLQGDGRWWAARYGLTFPLPPGQQLLLDQPCDPATERPRAEINQPTPGETVSGLVQIGGRATAPGFAGYQLQYGLGAEPSDWIDIQPYRAEPQPGGLLGLWDASAVEAGGPVTLRLVIYGPDNPYTDGPDRVRKEMRVLINLDRPTPTPEPTATETPTPEPTATAEPTATPEPPTAVPPTAVPPTAVPPTAVPPTAVPPTAAPPTAAPPTAVPPTPIPPEPTATLAPPATRVPTETPIPSPMPEPTATPEPPPTVAPEPTTYP